MGPPHETGCWFTSLTDDTHASSSELSSKVLLPSIQGVNAEQGTWADLHEDKVAERVQSCKLAHRLLCLFVGLSGSNVVETLHSTISHVSINQSQVSAEGG